MLFRIFRKLSVWINDLSFKCRIYEQDKWKLLFSKENSLAKYNVDDIYILANGPSLKDTIKTLNNESMDLKNKRDYCVVNYFANDPIFEKITPKYYVLTDPMFYKDTPLKDKVIDLYTLIVRKVTWPMVFFIQYKSRNSRMYDILKTNTNIKFSYLHSLRYTGNEQKRISRLISGVVGAECGNVVPHALYACMHLGYKKIHLYGVDHNFFDGMCLNENNELCTRKTYFYEDKPVLEPIRMHYSGKWVNYSVASFLQEKFSIFHQYEFMQQMAEQMGCQIINHTPGSLIDAFEHASTDE